jgi:hypothetical protein
MKRGRDRLLPYEQYHTRSVSAGPREPVLVVVVVVVVCIPSSVMSLRTQPGR